jgi:pyruvate-formate lyase-activating enzyme
MEQNNIFVFATNIQSLEDRIKIGNVFSSIPQIQQWNIDLEDIDCVLRIVSDSLSANNIIDLVVFHNFSCKELE